MGNLCQNVSLKIINVNIYFNRAIYVEEMKIYQE